jgi:hypothetical protein
MDRSDVVDVLTWDPSSNLLTWATAKLSQPRSNLAGQSILHRTAAVFAGGTAKVCTKKKDHAAHRPGPHVRGSVAASLGGHFGQRASGWKTLVPGWAVSGSDV